MENKEDLQEENRRLKNQIEMLELQVNGYEDIIAQMRDSLSWKITEPVRFIKARCTPLREIVNVIKIAREQGIHDALRQTRIEHDTYKHPYRPVITSYEYKEQVSKRNDIPISYHVVVCLYEDDQDNFQDAIKFVGRQTILPKDIYILYEKKGEESIKIPMANLQGEVSHKEEINIYVCDLPEFEEACKNFHKEDYIVLMSSDVTIAENCIYEFELERQRNRGLLCYSDASVRGAKKEFLYKPDFSPHYLMSENYVGELLSIEAGYFYEVLQALLSSTPDYEWNAFSFIYDILLTNLMEQKVFHIPKMLYQQGKTLQRRRIREQNSRERFWKIYENQAINTKYMLEPGLVEESSHIIEKNLEYPLVSIIIPNCDHVQDLKICINSIFEKSTYPNIEIFVVENNSKEKKTFAYYKELEKQGVNILYWEGEFNYSAINNYAVEHVNGEYVLMLNNDIEVISPAWIEEMMFYAKRNEVACVGAKLYFADNTIQHAGVVLGIRRLAGHVFRGMKGDADGYMHRMKVVQDYSIVTAACLLIQKSKFLNCDGFDERLAVDYNDVDLCLKLRKQGYYNVFTPYAALYHYESKSRGVNETTEKKARVEREFYYFNIKWHQAIKAGDPFYNKNLTLVDDSFGYKKKSDEIR